MTTDTRRLFWTLHIGGWVGYGTLNYLVGVEVAGKPADYFIPSGLYAVGGMAVTGCLRWVFRAVRNLNPRLLVAVSALGGALAAAVFTAFRSLVFFVYYERAGWLRQSLPDYFNLWDLYVSLYVIGTWSGLYFGIRYYHTAQQQEQRALRATIAAHDAQLQLLRYQLNPHFLFNALNAVATWVLEGDREGAGRLVTRLSAFLRYGLDSHPMRRATLEEELDVLSLYLDIEKTRFGSSLQVDIETEPDARSALMPRMLLQPLIEHIIRLGIAGFEGGGTISIAGFIEDGKLCLRVADSAHGGIGPNVSQAQGRASTNLDGMRERLSVMYGAGHDFRLERLEPDGLGVTISIPLEYRNRKNA